MRKRFISMEDSELEVDRAVDAQQAGDSTSPTDLTKVANYREELDKIKEGQNDDGSSGDGTGTADNGGGGDSGSADQNSGQNNSEGDGNGASNDDAGGQAGSDGGAGEGASGDGANEDSSGNDSPDEVTEETIEPSDENLATAQEAIDGQVTLVKMQAVLSASLEHGGISDSTSAIAIESVINSIKKRLGIPAESTGISMESFDSVSRRVVSTESLMTSISDTTKRVWEAIVKFFKAIWAWVKEFITGAKRSEMERAKEQQVTTKALMDAKKLEVDEAIQRNIASKLYKSRSVYLVDSDADIDFKQMYTISMQYQKLIEQYLSCAENIARRFATILSKLVSETIDIRLLDGLQINASDFRTMKLKDARTSIAMNVREENIALCSDPTIGNRRFYTTCSNEKYQANDASTQHQIVFSKFETEDSARGGVYFTPHADELQVINDYISKVLIVDEKRLIDFFNRDLSTINGMFSKIISGGPGVWKKMIDADGNTFDIQPEHAQVICAELSQALKLYSKTLINGTANIQEVFAKHISAMNDYVNTNIRMIQNSANSKKTGKTK
jgi:hypothetical protein